MDICPRAATRLFQAVVNKAFEDAILIEAPTWSKKKLKRRDGENDAAYHLRCEQSLARRKKTAVMQVARQREEAREFLLNNGKDFSEICTFAGYDPSYILGKASKLAAMGWPKLNAGMKIAA